MKIDLHPQNVAVVTLQTVLNRLATNPGLTVSRRRDLRSAVACFTRLVSQPPAGIALDLAAIRQTLDTMVPAWAKISRKRWANIRSELAAAIDASGLLPMLKTDGVELDAAWRPLMDEAPPWTRQSLSRLARWSSLRGIAPTAIDDGVIERFLAELDSSTLVRNLRYRSGLVRRAWNVLVAQHPTELRAVAVKTNTRVLKRIRWIDFPAPLRRDIEDYLEWASRPDPLAEGARKRALSASTLRLQRQQIHSAASAAIAAGLRIERLDSLAMLVQPDTVRNLLRHLWQQDGRALSAYTDGIAITLVAIASEWVKAPPELIATLKALRKQLGRLPSGLTEKNEAVLRTFDDPRLVTALVNLPDRLWRQARRSKSTYAFVALQTALAIDILIHAPVRMANLSAIRFDTHLHWPQGPRKPALLTFRAEETKNGAPLKFELPAVLSDRLQVYRNEIALAVIGRKPDTLFVTRMGDPKRQATIAVAIHKTILRNLGVKLTPHQFRHLCAKLILDRNPGAYELVRQMLGHSRASTTADFYAGIDTLRAGRAHAELVNELRQSNFHRRRHRPAHRGES
jgi:integrase